MMEMMDLVFNIFVFFVATYFVSLMFSLGMFISKEAERINELAAMEEDQNSLEVKHG